MIRIGMILMVIALWCYTLAIWKERFAKKLLIWMIVVFTIAYVCDIIGTSIMFYISETKFHLTIHSGFGYVALGIMSLHFVWAILSIKKIRRFEEYFTRFSIMAWGAWLAAFISGMIMSML